MSKNNLDEMRKILLATFFHFEDCLVFNVDERISRILHPRLSFP